MENKNKLSLTCIYKDGRVRDISVNFFNVRWVCEKILGKSFGTYKWYVSDDLNFVHLKNFVFGGRPHFEINDDTVVIFENCYFEGDIFYFTGGQVQIINSSFSSKRQIDLKVRNCSDFEFVLDENYVLEKDSKISFEAMDCGKFSVKGKNCYYGFNIFADECYLDSIKNLEQFHVIAKKLEIANSDLVFGDKEIGGKNIFTGVVDVNDLVLNNVLIDDFSNTFEAKINTLSGKNYEVKFKKMITINDNCYFNKTNNDSVMIFSDDKEVKSRMDLISVLKGYREFLSNEIEKMVKDKISVYDQKLMEQEKIIENEQEKLKVLKREINDKDCEHRKRLRHTKARDIIKK